MRLVCSLLLLFALVGSIAFANSSIPIPVFKPHMHHEVAADADWYSKLGEGQGIDCCANQHCRRTTYCFDDVTGEGVVVDNECFPLPYDRVVTPPLGVQLEPDEVHVCVSGGKIRCVTGGGQV